MTPMSDGSDLYPTEWTKRQDQFGIEYRQIGPSRYEIRSNSYLITVDEEGFNLYWGSMLAFEKWCQLNNVEAIPRSDLDG